MNMYQAVRPLLFSLAPERAHEFSLSTLKWAEQLGVLQAVYKQHYKPVTCMGIQFPNPVGLAAGLDKNGDYIDALAALGYGFIEIGTVTPRPQVGNPHPRLFRIPQAQAIINRMGFNNDGVDKLVQNVRASNYGGVLGINIGKNADTAIEKAADDYNDCLNKVYPFASYITVNISSPNTKGLRHLQYGQPLIQLLDRIKSRHLFLAQYYQFYVPLVIKVSPDLNQEEVAFISEQILQFGIDGVIATNTSISRQGVSYLPDGKEEGGLSGAPIFEQSTDCLRWFKHYLADEVPLIGAGGISTAEHAFLKQQAGASLVQIYTGMIYQGPKLIERCAKILV